MQDLAPAVPLKTWPRPCRWSIRAKVRGIHRREGGVLPTEGCQRLHQRGIEIEEVEVSAAMAEGKVGLQRADGVGGQDCRPQLRQLQCCVIQQPTVPGGAVRHAAHGGGDAGEHLFDARVEGLEQGGGAIDREACACRCIELGAGAVNLGDRRGDAGALGAQLCGEQARTGLGIRGPGSRVLRTRQARAPRAGRSQWAPDRHVRLAAAARRGRWPG